MDSPDLQTLGTALLGLVLLALVPLGFIVYGRIARKIFTGDSKVSVDRIGIPELLVGFLLITMFLGLIAFSLDMEPQKIESGDILHGSIFYLFLVTAIAVFLQLRGRDVVELFGFRELRFPQALGRGFVLILAAFPLMILVPVVVHQFLGPEPQQQDVVNFFKDAARNSDAIGMASTVFMASILAPFAEEFIFRGFLYGVTKRFLGIVPAILFTSALFAAIHMNLAALPALFVLAICLNLAYENTGSLTVPMVMHAIFNFSQLVLLYLATRFSIPV